MGKIWLALLRWLRSLRKIPMLKVRWIRKVAGGAFVIAGIIGGFLPIVPGFLFFIIGVFLLFDFRWPFRRRANSEKLDIRN